MPNLHSIASITLSFMLALPTRAVAQLEGEIYSPSDSAARESLSETMKSQLQMMLAQSAEEEVRRRALPMMEDFKKKYPFLRLNPETNPVLAEMILGASEKTLNEYFETMHERLRAGATSHYSAKLENASPKFRADILEVLPKVLEDLKSDVSKARIAGAMAESLRWEWIHILNQPDPVKESAKKGPETPNETRVPVVFKNDGKGNSNSKSAEAMPGYLAVINDSDEKIREDSPESLWKKHAKGVAAGAVEFGRQSTFFNIPIGAIALFELGMEYSKDPLAFERFLQSLGDPVAHASFAAFMVTNHALTHQLQGVMNGTISRHFLPYIGMSAGLMVSSSFGEMFHDKDIRNCVRGFMGIKDGDRRRCQIAYDNWVPSKKIDQYTPQIISMSASTLGSGVLQGAAKLGLRSKDLMWSYRLGGMRAARATFQMGKAGMGPVGFIATNGLFLVLDKLAFAPVDDWWKRSSLTKWSLGDGFADKTALGTWETGWRMLIYGNEDLTAKVNSLPAAHQKLSDSLAYYDARNWQYRSMVECVPEDMKALDVYNLPLISRRADIRECLSKRDLLTNIKNMGEIQSRWRQELLRKMTASSDSWTQALSSYNTVFNASTAAYGKMINSLHAISQGRNEVKGEKIDLSFNAFSKNVFEVSKLKPTKLQTEDERAQSAGLFPTNVGPFHTPQLVDFVLLSMACGPDLKAAPTFWQKFASTSWMPWKQLHNVAPAIVGLGEVPEPKNQMIQNPYGSRMMFYPPAIVKEPGALCERQFLKMNPEGSYAVGPADENGFVEMRNYTTPLRVKGIVYQGILDYLIKNADPELLGNLDKISDFSVWWDDNVIEPSKDAWATFRKDYEDLLEAHFLPIVTKSEKSDPKAPQDLISALQAEVDVYETILQSLLTSVNRGEAHAMDQSEHLSRRFKALKSQFETDITTEKDDFDRKTSEQIIKNIAGWMTTKLAQDRMLMKPSERLADYRPKVFVATLSQLSNVLTDRERVQQFLNVLQFSNRDKAATTTTSPRKSSDPRARY